MSFNDVFMLFQSPVISGFAWFFILTSVFYIARIPAHKAIYSFTRVIHNALRLTAQSVCQAEKRMLERNKEVLLTQGREATEHIIEREFERINDTVQKDLSEYPALHRLLSEEITCINEDYQASTDVPPAPPGWVKAIEAVAKIPGSKGDTMVGNVLEDIHQSMLKANTRVTEEYRKTSHKRHQLLSGMMPHWRRVSQTLAQVDKNINSLLLRSVSIDRHMDEYEHIQAGSERALQRLSSSSLTQFFISAFVLLIAVGGAMINFNLIARPMSEMVGGTSQLMGFQTSEIAALVIILVEIAMGLFLMESLRITRLFPLIGALNDKLRIKMIWITFGILLTLACVEAGLAYMRELLMQDAAATRALLREDGVEVIASSYLWITTAAQMGMGFILPFALTFIAIPLESFVHSLRTVMGIVLVGLLRSLSWLLRLTGNIARFSGAMLVSFYDLFIFAPLWIEHQFRFRQKAPDNKEENESPDDVQYGSLSRS
ncbi:hypothetical protein MNBD_GAMMA24-2012 [hydrothermal vent metagenome]|uniref:Uncharacterized protein n=1 Tax=hydrothermal vent metagenome TaxID=652676 RepID=A0A3B1B7L8_9ZZZZ